MVSIKGALRKARQLFQPAPLSEGEFRQRVSYWQQAFYKNPALGRQAAEDFVRRFNANSPSVLFRADQTRIGDQRDVLTTFGRIYSTNMWGSGSGGGSGLHDHVAMYLGFLETFIIRHKIKSIVDVGCGDWQFTQYMNLQGADYVGIDAAQSVVDDNTDRFGKTRRGVTFVCLDASIGVPNCDLVISKDVLQHLGNDTAKMVLQQIRDCPNIIITNDYHPANADCRNGDTRPLDISRPPFDAVVRPRLAFDEKVTFVKEAPII